MIFYDVIPVAFTHKGNHFCPKVYIHTQTLVEFIEIYALGEAPAGMPTRNFVFPKETLTKGRWLPSIHTPMLRALGAGL